MPNTFFAKNLENGAGWRGDNLWTKVPKVTPLCHCFDPGKDMKKHDLTPIDISSHLHAKHRSSSKMLQEFVIYVFIKSWSLSTVYKIVQI